MPFSLLIYVRRIFFLLTGAFLLSGCHHLQESDTKSLPQNSAIIWTSIYQSPHCSHKEAKVQSGLASASPNLFQQELEFKSRKIIGSASPQPEIPTTGSLISIAMGQKPSGGYGISVSKVTQSDNQVTITVDWQTPSPDSMTTSALTSPCEIIALELPDNEQALKQLQIEVIDQNGLFPLK